MALWPIRRPGNCSGANTILPPESTACGGRHRGLVAAQLSCARLCVTLAQGSLPLLHLLGMLSLLCTLLLRQEETLDATSSGAAHRYSPCCSHGSRDLRHEGCRVPGARAGTACAAHHIIIVQILQHIMYSSIKVVAIGDLHIHVCWYEMDSCTGVDVHNTGIDARNCWVVGECKGVGIGIVPCGSLWWALRGLLQPSWAVR